MLTQEFLPNLLNYMLKFIVRIYDVMASGKECTSSNLGDSPNKFPKHLA
jgi:hypothetical protein